MEVLKKKADTERDPNPAHNAQGGTIRMPDISQYQAIHQEARELLEGGNREELRRFQETSAKINQLLTVSGVLTESQ